MPGSHLQRFCFHGLGCDLDNRIFKKLPGESNMHLELRATRLKNSVPGWNASGHLRLNGMTALEIVKAFG